MITIEELLSDLLLKHSCVIIPKFGGFVAKQTSAKIDFERNFVTPPSKNLLFNKNLIANDGLLVNELANKNRWSFQDSEQCVFKFVDEINLQLKNSKQFSLPRIGSFHLDSEGNISFEQDRYFNFLLNAYGLTAVQFVSKIEVEKSEVELQTIKKSPVIPIERGRSNFWKYAAAACLIPIAFYSVWIPTRTNVLQSGLISHNDFNPFYKQEEGNYKKKPLILHKETKQESFEDRLSPISDTYFANFQLDSDHFFKVRMRRKSLAVNNSIKENSSQIKEVKGGFQNFTGMKTYQYVLGCFANLSNATNFYNKLKSLGLVVNKTSAGSLTRISIGSSNDIDSLQEEIAKANSLGYQGWILKN